MRSRAIFLQTSPKARDDEPLTFFIRGPLGRNKTSNLISKLCKAEGVRGIGEKDHVTTHGLRATTTSLLVEAGHPDSSTAMRTGHRDMRSLKNYQNLSGAIGKRQDQDILRSTGSASKRSTNPNTQGARIMFGSKKMRGDIVEPLTAGHSDENDASVANTCNASAKSVSRNSEAVSILSDIASISGGSFTFNISYNQEK